MVPAPGWNFLPRIIHRPNPIHESGDGKKATNSEEAEYEVPVAPEEIPRISAINSQEAMGASHTFISRGSAMKETVAGSHGTVCEKTQPNPRAPAPDTYQQKRKRADKYDVGEENFARQRKSARISTRRRAKSPLAVAKTSRGSSSPSADSPQLGLTHVKVSSVPVREVHFVQPETGSESNPVKKKRRRGRPPKKITAPRSPVPEIIRKDDNPTQIPFTQSPHGKLRPLPTRSGSSEGGSSLKPTNEVEVCESYETSSKRQGRPRSEPSNSGGPEHCSGGSGDVADIKQDEDGGESVESVSQRASSEMLQNEAESFLDLLKRSLDEMRIILDHVGCKLNKEEGTWSRVTTQRKLRSPSCRTVQKRLSRLTKCYEAMTTAKNADDQPAFELLHAKLLTAVESLTTGADNILILLTDRDPDDINAVLMDLYLILLPQFVETTKIGAESCESHGSISTLHLQDTSTLISCLVSLASKAVRHKNRPKSDRQQRQISKPVGMLVRIASELKDDIFEELETRKEKLKLKEYERTQLERDRKRRERRKAQMEEDEAEKQKKIKEIHQKQREALRETYRNPDYGHILWAETTKKVEELDMAARMQDSPPPR